MNWNLQPSLLLGLALLVGSWLAATGPLRKSIPGSRPVPTAQVVYFLASVFVLFAALVSPIDEIGDHYLFSVHMVQHLLLTLAFPPLFLMGLPDWLIRPLLRVRLIERLAKFLVRPAIAFALFNVLFAAYHVPAIYDFTLENELVHIGVHLALIATATITWMPILSPLRELPRLSYPLQIFYLFLEANPPTVLASLITFASEALYPAYAAAPRAFGISALEDQQVAGLVMWIPGTFVYLLALTIVFFKWFGGAQTAEQELLS